MLSEQANSTDKREDAGGDKTSPNSQYECNICLDTARDAVISMCGHLFCWPCLHKWIETKPNNQTCPVCKSAISKEKVIPLYGRNCTDKKDPRDKVPPRPQGQRSEATRNVNSFFIIYTLFKINKNLIEINKELIGIWRIRGTPGVVRHWCISF